MAEKEGYTPRRNAPSNRARPGQNRIYSHLGVRDLRELLDQKRSERGCIGEGSIPPPDPTYNYLKDPLRESADDNCHERPLKQNNPQHHPNKNHPNNLRRDRDHYSGNPSKNKDIANPLSIKVEFSTATGEHVYKIDESTVLPTIKHVPDRLPPPSRSFRGRGRGRGRGQQRGYQTRTIRNNTANKQRLSEDVRQETSPREILDDGEENWDDSNETKNHEEQLPDDDNLQNQTEDDSLEKQIESLKLDEAEKE